MECFEADCRVLSAPTALVRPLLAFCWRGLSVGWAGVLFDAGAREGDGATGACGDVRLPEKHLVRYSTGNAPKYPSHFWRMLSQRFFAFFIEWQVSASWLSREDVAVGRKGKTSEEDGQSRVPHGAASTSVRISDNERRSDHE